MIRREILYPYGNSRIITKCCLSSLTRCPLILRGDKSGNTEKFINATHKDGIVIVIKFS